jgi:hypothetical protein
VVVAMDLCDDCTLRSWILSFGRGARVLAPAPLVEAISEELDQAGRQYGPGGFLPPFDDEAQPLLPFAFERLTTDVERTSGSGAGQASRPHDASR